MLYSIRMRAAQGGAHEAGGRHISGAERLADESELEQIAAGMLKRALTHSRGRADFVNITVEAVEQDDIRFVHILPVTTVDVGDVEAGRKAAQAELIKKGVVRTAVQQGFTRLTALTDSMRGAMLLCAQTGRRLDDRGQRGVRVSRMDVADKVEFEKWLAKLRLGGDHIREAVVLASKVASAAGIVAELCWSDDPEYTAGYVASVSGYVRFPHLKVYGSPIGGRIFFVKPGTDLAQLTAYLERRPVLVTVPEQEGESQWNL